MTKVIITIPMIRHRTTATLILSEWPEADDLEDMIEQLRFRMYMMNKQAERQYIKAPIKHPPVKWTPQILERNSHA